MMMKKKKQRRGGGGGGEVNLRTSSGLQAYCQLARKIDMAVCRYLYQHCAQIQKYIYSIIRRD